MRSQLETSWDSFSSTDLLGIFIFVKLLEVLWRLYLSHRQQMVINSSVEVPRELSYFVSQESYEKTRITAGKQLVSSTTAMLMDTFLTVGFLASKGPKYVWELTRTLSASLEFQNFVFVFIIVSLRHLKLVAMKILLLNPSNFYSKNACQRGYSFCLKGYLDDLVYFLSVAQAFNNGLDTSPNFPLALLAASGLYRALSYEVHLRYLVSSRARPLPEGELRDRVEDMAETFHYPRSSILNMDSCQVEGYMTGIQSGVIVLSKVLDGYYREDQGGGHAKTFEIQEILAVVGHELCHWSYWHRLKAALFHQIMFGVKLLISLKFMYEEKLFEGFFITGPSPPLLGFILTHYCILENFSFLLGWMERGYLRSQEFEADKFVRVIGKGPQLRSALLKMNARCEIFPAVDPLYSSFYLSLPPPLERVRALSQPLRMRVVLRHRVH